jgi:hypothetical protein
MRRTLARCADRGYRDRIAEMCFAHALASGNVSLILYDVTTLPSDRGRAAGRPARVPLEIGCFEGNQAEKLTILPVIRQFQARHGLQAMVVVADARMLPAANLADLDDARLGFIVGSRVTKAPAGLESHFRWHGDAFSDGQVIDTSPRRPGRTRTTTLPCGPSPPGTSSAVRSPPARRESRS